MIETYSACAYCFEPLEIGSRCDCLTSKNQPSKTVIRYAESIDMDSYESHPGIDGYNITESAVAPGDVIGAKVFLAPHVELCDKCYKTFKDTCEILGHVIASCDHQKTSIGTDSDDES